MAILGRNTASGFGNFALADQIRVYRVTVSGATVQLNELYASLSNSGATVTVRMVCYAADGASGDPGTLLAITPDVSVPSSGYTTRGGLVVTPAVLAAGNYWLGVHLGGPNSISYDDDGAGATRRSNTDTFSDGAANPWAGTGATIVGSLQCWGVTGAVTAPQPRPVRINTSQGWVDIADQSSFVSGTGAPTAAVGATGAIYLDTVTGRMYGPKAAGAWPSTSFGRLLIPGNTYADVAASYTDYAKLLAG